MNTRQTGAGSIEKVWQMRELEVRLALVCFGGASLAVYMNGVSHEILKLVRASKVYHGLSTEQKADLSLTYDDCAGDPAYSSDTERHYFELLQAIGKTVDLRVIVDVISGASAGGINGIFLARALAFDLDFDPLRKMWMQLGDIEELMEEETLAERWSKIYMYPLVWAFGNRIWKGEQPYKEARRKLSRFVRSRWFEPPFSGTRMLKWMIDANWNMGEAKPGSTLLPTGHQLDLFVSLTNFYGQQRKVAMHDPEEIDEQQHKVNLTFSHLQGPRSPRYSDFDDTNIPGLGFAARATSSFPGAFPPMRIKDLKSFLKTEGSDWPHETDFMQKNFSLLQEEPDEIEQMSFIDGGVTNNKPFASAIKAITNKPAHREVDRRVIFVDPRPGEPLSKNPNLGKNERPVPGFFRAILSSLAAIPRDEPILDDLQDIEQQNRQARRFETVMKRIELDVSALVDRILVLEPGKPVSTAMLASWRERAHEQAHVEAGFGYGSYVEAKGVQLVDRLSTFLIDWQRERGLKEPPVRLTDITEWAHDAGYLGSSDATCRHTIPFFRRFDVDFRVRRLRFMIKRLNRYLQQDRNKAGSVSYSELKAQIYDSIARYRRRWQPKFYNNVPLGETVVETLNNIGTKMALEDRDFEEDKLLAEAINSVADESLRKTLFHAYVGFAFYDIATLPMTAHADLLEIDEVRVDRISPLDCTDLHGDDENGPLMGDKLFNFGAFFSRRARENDYIWGRIHAANRLVDFLCDAAGEDVVCGNLDLVELRKKLALSILETEAEHTVASEELIAKLRKNFSF